MRRLGQHFLRNKSALRLIVRAVNPKAGEVIVEIGPGHGELTKEIQNSKVKSQNCNSKVKIIGIEKDEGLAESLRKKFAGEENVEIVAGDALRLLPSIIQNLKPKTYKVAGNIPYYITGRLLRTIGELEPKPERCVFTLQKEVAERLIAEPQKMNSVRGREGSRRHSASYEMNRLAAAVQFWAEPKTLSFLPKTDFQPPPKVDSAIVLLKTKKPAAKVEPDDYYRLVRILFQQPRKTIFNNLTAGGLSRETATKALKQSGLDPNLRPQNLKVKDILRLVDDLRKV